MAYFQPTIQTQAAWDKASSDKQTTKMNNNITLLILADAKFSSVTHAYCATHGYTFPIDALNAVYGKVGDPTADDANNVNAMMVKMVEDMTIIFSTIP
jgi:hypothetical protein